MLGFISEQASSSGKDRVKKAGDIARALGGYLYTLSDEQEVQAVHEWLRDLLYQDRRRLAVEL